MNTKKISLLLSILTINAINADTTKPDPESFYEQACHWAQEVVDEIRNIDPINAGFALATALAVNKGVDYALPKTLKQLEEEKNEALTIINQQQKEEPEIIYALQQKYEKFTKVPKKETVAYLQAEHEFYQAARAYEQVSPICQQAIQKIDQAQSPKELLDAKNKALELYQKPILTSPEMYTEKRRKVEQEYDQAKTKPLMPSLLKTLSTRTLSMATWINIYNSLQIQQGKKPINIPLLHYVDFNTTMADSSWGVKINITRFLEYLRIG